MSFSAEFSNRRSGLWDIVRRRRLLLSIVFSYALVGSLIGHSIELDFWPTVRTYMSSGLNILRFLLSLFGGIYLIWRFADAVFRVKPKKPIQWFIDDLRSTFLGPANLLEGLICFLTVSVFLATFVFFKNLIPFFNPFTWDPLFASLDRSLHGGVDAWTWTWRIFGSPFATYLLNLAYHIWFILVYLAIFAASFDRKDPGRGAVFLVAFVLIYIVGGTILAMIFSSGGPVYFEAFGYGGTYAEQMQKLEEIGETHTLWALEVQKAVLAEYQDRGFSVISAMPSMHVASSVIIALFGFSYSRWLGWLLSAFAVCIVIGSVHLAWHYAVDGYAGIAVAFACWWCAKALVHRYGEA